MGLSLTKKKSIIFLLTTTEQVQVDKMTFTAAHAFHYDHVGLGLLQHGLDAHWMTVIVNCFAADLSVGLLLESDAAAKECFWPHSCR